MTEQMTLVDFVRVRLLTEQDNAYRARHKASRVWADFLGRTPRREAEAELRANIAAANLRVWEQCRAVVGSQPVDERTRRAFNAGAGVLAWKVLRELAEPYRGHPDYDETWPT